MKPEARPQLAKERIAAVLSQWRQPSDTPDFDEIAISPTHVARIRLDPPMVHYLRETVLRRRRFAVYQKISDDNRGADGI